MTHLEKIYSRPGRILKLNLIVFLFPQKLSDIKSPRWIVWLLGWVGPRPSAGQSAMIVCVQGWAVSDSGGMCGVSGGGAI